MREPMFLNTAHICVDMQRMFAEDTEWHAPWLNKVLPAVEALTEKHPTQTLFTRFIPSLTADTANGAWQLYYKKWSSMTLGRMDPELLDLVPSLSRYAAPNNFIDKRVYSPWYDPKLIRRLRALRIETLVISGGETDVCVAATVMGAIDHGFRVILPVDAVFGSADETHDAMLRIFDSRYALQLTTCRTQDVLDSWEP